MLCKKKKKKKEKRKIKLRISWQFFFATERNSVTFLSHANDAKQTSFAEVPIYYFLLQLIINLNEWTIEKLRSLHT